MVVVEPAARSAATSRVIIISFDTALMKSGQQVIRAGYIVSAITGAVEHEAMEQGVYVYTFNTLSQERRTKGQKQSEDGNCVVDEWKCD